MVSAAVALMALGSGALAGFYIALDMLRTRNMATGKFRHLIEPGDPLIARPPAKNTT